MTFLYLGEVIKSKVVKPLASLKFAVVVISAIAVIVAWGTIIEAKYLDAKIAQETVYHSWFAYFVFALFATNLIADMVSGDDCSRGTNLISDLPC